MHDFSHKKPWLTPLKLAAIAVLLLLGLGVAFLVTVMYADPKVTVDYGAKAHELVRKRQNMPPDALNEWDLIGRIAAKHTAAREAVQARNPDWPLIAFDFTLLYRPDAEASKDTTREHTIAAATEWIAEFRALGGLDDLARLPKITFAARPAQEGAFINVLLPELGQMRSIARMNAARMALAANAGDDAERLAAFEQSLASARLLGAQQTLIDALVGNAIDALACGELRHELIEHPPTAAAARDLLAAMDRQQLPSLGPVFDTERFFSLDTIQRTFSDDGGGNGRFLPTAAAEFGMDTAGTTFGVPVRAETFRVFNVLGLLHPDRRSTEARANEIYDHFMKVSAMTRAERAAMTAPDPTAGLQRFKILELMVPAFGKALQSRDQIDADLAATRLILALEIHHAEKWAYPATLAELAPSIVPEVPLDATNGKPFGYRLLAPGEDAHGRGFLLYSVGTDGVDNGGSMGATPDRVVTPFQASGLTDFVYNQPRPAPKPVDESAAPVKPAEPPTQDVHIAPAPSPGKN